MSSSLPRFISEKEIAERKLRDAAEGKKEEPYDPRPLYDRLQAERARQQEEYEASTAFKNQIHRLDPDEAAFLAKIDRERCLLQESVDQEAEQLIQEAKISSSLPCLSSCHKTFLTSDYAANRSSLMKVSVSSSSNAEVSVRRPPIPSSSTPLNQRSLLAGIKRKSSQVPKIDAKKSHLDGANNDLESSPSDTTVDLTKSQDELANNVEPQLSSPNNDLPNPLNEVSPTWHKQLRHRLACPVSCLVWRLTVTRMRVLTTATGIPPRALRMLPSFSPRLPSFVASRPTNQMLVNRPSLPFPMSDCY
uniref:NEFA interacting nuclear protein NIP30 N terminal n=1 Tax=Echinococcus granulosus TaxID=6210 RepID=A0A068WMK4_ECHGR|nr:NEFA interacting nuclear protein NIP30 N terminal [Echinococcus granulosus]